MSSPLGVASNPNWRDQLRVACAQFAGSTDLEHNLATCLDAIDQAAEADADLVVLPEFANHLSVYESAAHCREVAVAADGPWLRSIGDRAAQHRIHVAVTVTMPRRQGHTTATSVLFDHHGQMIGQADKQTLMGNERAFLVGGDRGAPVVDTVFGPVGIYACMDGVTFETPRSFAVRGARLLLNGLNSFALDEAALHIPVRAVENGVFVAAANKVGPLLPAHQVDAFSHALGIPAHALDGAGESQIVAPDGTIVAQASRCDTEMVWADIDLSHVAPVTDRFRHRRPETYGLLAQPENRPLRQLDDRALTVASVESADQVTAAVADGAQLIVLPELMVPPTVISPGVFVVTTAIDGGAHVGRVYTSEGLVHEQRQLHASERFPTVDVLSDVVSVFSAPWGDVALIVGDDHLYPETMRMAAIAGAHIAVVCWSPQRRVDAELALAERAAENRLCVVASTSAVPFAARVLNPPRDSLWNPDRVADYDGTINTPEVVVAQAGMPLIADLHPERSLDRHISRDTDLVGGRAWQASRYLASA